MKIVWHLLASARDELGYSSALLGNQLMESYDACVTGFMEKSSVTIGTTLMAAMIAMASYNSALADTRVTIGAGVEKCSVWNAARVKHSSLEYQAWVFGAFSGANAMSSVDFLKDTDGDGLLALVDQECQLRPNESIHDAVVRIVDRYMQ